MEPALFARIFLPVLLVAGSANAEEARESTEGETGPHEQWNDVCTDWDEWDKPGAPYRIFANTYYVGTCGISAILVTTPGGNVLFDTGTRGGAEVVARNIQQLGYELSDVSVVTHSHEHFDHVGGFAWFTEQSGASVFASQVGAEVLQSGVVGADDPQHGMHEPMEPVDVALVIDEARAFEIGDMLFTSIATPGHTPGALTWHWESCEIEAENKVCKAIVYADSLSPVSRDDYKFSEHPEYLAEYRAGIAKLRDLKCDILLTPHPSHSNMVERAATGTLEGGMSCVEYADSKSKALDERLANEAVAK